MPTIANSNTTTKNELIDVVTPSILSTIAASTGAGLVGIADAEEKFNNTIVESVLGEILDIINNSIKNRLLGSGDTFINIGTFKYIKLDEGYKTIILSCSEDSLVLFGNLGDLIDGTNGMYFPAGSEILFVKDNTTHILVKPVYNNCSVKVTNLYKDAFEKTTTTTRIDYTAGSSNIALPTGGTVRLCTLTECYINFGNLSVTASSSNTLLYPGVKRLVVPTGSTHVAAIRKSINNSLYITGELHT